MPNPNAPQEDEELDLEGLDAEPIDYSSMDLEGLDAQTPDGQPIGGPEPGRFRKVWNTLNQPLTDAPSRFAKSIADDIDNPLGVGGYGKGFLAGAGQAAGDLVTSLTSPIELGAALLSGGESLALKSGARGLARAANVAGNVPMIARGIEQLDADNYGGAAVDIGAGAIGLKKFSKAADAAAALPKKGMSASTATAAAANAPLPGTVKIKRPSSELLNKLRGNGYRFSHVGTDGFPVWKLTDDPSAINARKPESLARRLWNVPRGATTTADFSAPFRQGLGLIHKKEWWASQGAMIKSWASQEGYDKVMDDIASHPYFAETAEDVFDNAGKHIRTKRVKSFAEEAGLAINNTIDRREEQLASAMLEKIPGYGRLVKASNRAYTAYLNKLRADTFTSLIDANNAKDNMPLAKALAEFVNTATGRGSLGRFEKNAQVLTDALFSPRLVASRVRMLNPATYVMAPKGVRQEYVKSMLAMGVTWSTIAGLGAMAGGKVGTDITSSDFGKIKLGNTRLDPAGGFQQYLVAMARFARGQTTSSNTGKTREFGAEFGSPTRLNLLIDFASNKSHPLMKLGYDFLNASKYRPVGVGDRLAQMFPPMIAQDALEIMKDDPTLLPLLIPAAGGMSTQTYDREENEGKLVPRDMDVLFEGGGF